MTSPRVSFALLLAASSAGCALRADFCSSLDAATDTFAPDVIPMDAGPDLGASEAGPMESGTPFVDADVVDQDVLETGVRDTPRDGPPTLGPSALLGLGASRAVSVVPGLAERGEYVVYYASSGATPHLAARVQYHHDLVCQADWGAVSDGVHDVVLDGHPANAGPEIVVPVWNYDTGAQELWVREPGPLSAMVMTSPCVPGSKPWVVLPSAIEGVRIESGPTATTVLNGTGEIRYIFAAGTKDGVRNQTVAYWRAMGDPTGWQPWKPSGIPDLPFDEEFLSQPSAVQYRGGLSLVAFTRKRSDGAICMRGARMDPATRTWSESWLGLHGSECSRVHDELPAPPNTALASWSGYLNDDWVLYYAYGADTGSVFVGRWSETLEWNDWATATNQAWSNPISATVTPIPTFVIQGGPPFATRLELLAVDANAQSMRWLYTATSNQGAWPVAGWDWLSSSLL